MKPLATTVIFAVFACQLTQAQLRVERVSIEPNVGLAIPIPTQNMASPPLALMGNLAVETSRGWVMAVEGGSVSFRNPDFPKKIQFLLSKSYVRDENSFYGLRFGKAFRIDSSGAKIVFSAGVNSLQVVEPIRIKSGLLATSVDRETKHRLNVPVQLDFWIPFNRNQTKSFVVTARGNVNANRSFLIFGLGCKAVLFKNERSKKQKHSDSDNFSL